ncbi:hypothetical protein Lal_00008647 [Lupinus albus]|nr:hypothetical protein Lal_00008647 [Lupinus albus]
MKSNQFGVKPLHLKSEKLMQQLSVIDYCKWTLGLEEAEEELTSCLTLPPTPTNVRVKRCECLRDTYKHREKVKMGRVETGPFNDTHLSNFLHDFQPPSLTDPSTCHACTNFETCSFCIDEFLNIDIDVPCTSLYTCHARTDSELCDSCIDEFLNIVVDSPVTHLHCTNTIDAGIIQQSDLCVQAPDWIPPFDLECNIAVYALGLSFIECKRLSVRDIFGTKDILAITSGRCVLKHLQDNKDPILWFDSLPTDKENLSFGVAPAKNLCSLLIQV